MGHGKALAIKGVMTIVVLYLVLGLGFDISFMNVLLITLVLGLLSYMLGDLFILPKTSNLVATMADLGMAFVVIWLLGMALTGLSGGTMAGAAIIAALVMAVGEYFFHKYIFNNNITSHRSYRTSHES